MATLARVGRVLSPALANEANLHITDILGHRATPSFADRALADAQSIYPSAFGKSSEEYG
jgi:hypothetical protein